LRITPRDLIGVARVEALHLTRDAAKRSVLGSVAVAGISRSTATCTEAYLLAVAEDRMNSTDVIDHMAVVERAGADAVISGHSADRRPAGGRDIHGKEQPVRI